MSAVVVFTVLVRYRAMRFKLKEGEKSDEAEAEKMREKRAAPRL